MSANGILVVLNAGRGETPACPQARFDRNDVVKVRRLKFLRHLPEFGAIVAIVPPGFPAEYALADVAGRARPLMITAPSRAVSYIVAFDGDPTPHLLREAYLKPSGKPPAEVGWCAEPTP